MKTVSTLLGVLLRGWTPKPEPEDQEPGLYCDLSEHSHRCWAFEFFFKRIESLYFIGKYFFHSNLKFNYLLS